jgi:Flp pilus assembly protein TadB
VAEEWTVETLRVHLQALLLAEHHANEVRFLAMEKATVAALAAAQRAVEKAEIAVEKRLEGMNEFRGSLADQARLLMPRGEADSRINALSETLKELASRIDRQEGRGSGLNAGWGYLVGAVGLVAAIIAIFLKLAG